MSRQFAHLVSNGVNLTDGVGSSLLAAVGQRRDLAFVKDKRLYSALFGSHHFRGDDNGGTGAGFAYWRVIAGLGDNQYGGVIILDGSYYCWFHYDGTVLNPFPQAFYRIPRIPRVYPEIWNGSRYFANDLPFWPLNSISLAEQPGLGGGFNGRSAQLSSLRIQGAIKGHLDPSDTTLSNREYWDNVRLMVVMDFAPVIVPVQPGFGYIPNFSYAEFMSNLFLLPVMGVSVNLNPQGRSRFRVLHDELYSWTAQRSFNSLKQPFSRTIGSFNAVPSGDPDSDPVVPPTDSPAVFGFNLHEKGSIGLVAGAGVYVPGQGAFSSATMGNYAMAGAVAAYQGVYPNPALAPLGCPADTKTSDQENIVTAHMAATSDAFPVLGCEVYTAAFDDNYAYQDARTGIIGPGGINVDINLDLSRYYTRYNDAGGIVSGAIWLVAVSDNETSAFFSFKDRTAENPLLERSGLDSCVTYVEF